jgi:hypothetical protein
MHHALAEITSANALREPGHPTMAPWLDKDMSRPTRPGKPTNNDGKSPCYQWVNHGKSTISTGPCSIANCKKLPEGRLQVPQNHCPWNSGNSQPNLNIGSWPWKYTNYVDKATWRAHAPRNRIQLQSLMIRHLPHQLILRKTSVFFPQDLSSSETLRRGKCSFHTSNSMNPKKFFSIFLPR